MQLFTRRFIKDLFIIALFIACFYFLTHNPLTHPELPDTTGYWSIQLMQQPLILGLAGHNYLVLKNENNTIIKELHGLATDPKTGNWKYIGNEYTDELQVFEFDSPRYYVTQKNFAGIVLYQGNKDDTFSLWNRALPCKEKINTLKILYPPYGVKINGDTENSNSVSYTLMLCMGLGTEHLGLLTPGWGKNLLSDN